ncbi:MAG: SDR family oxidoreductase [Paracoccaceae bacterium]
MPARAPRCWPATSTRARSAGSPPRCRGSGPMRPISPPRRGGAGWPAEAARARAALWISWPTPPPSSVSAPIAQMTLADWHTTTAGEIDTVFLVTRALWPLLETSGAASIVNFASANAHVALAGLPAIAHTAGKGAVLAMTRQMAMEGGPKRIRANTIAPGFTVTEETEQHLDTPLMQNVRAKLMVDRLGTTEDIGHLAIYLGSDESGYVTGADFRIDGGATAW